jgi:hypothetical protein
MNLLILSSAFVQYYLNFSGYPSDKNPLRNISLHTFVSTKHINVQGFHEHIVISHYTSILTPSTSSWRRA